VRTLMHSWAAICTSAIQRREPRPRASWQEDGPDTELLSTAFGRYRAFFDLLTKV
jgi:hypothetical protein